MRASCAREGQAAMGAREGDPRCLNLLNDTTGASVWRRLARLVNDEPRLRLYRHTVLYERDRKEIVGSVITSSPVESLEHRLHHALLPMNCITSCRVSKTSVE